MDNTLFDWFDAWCGSFQPFLAVLLSRIGLDRSALIAQIKAVHEKHQTSEYAFLLQELPAIQGLPDDERRSVSEEAIAAFRKGRAERLALFPGVLDTLLALKESGVKVVAYTESQAFYTMRRLKKFGLDGVIDVLYSSEDHDIPANIDLTQIRTMESSYYQLEYTVHRHTPAGALKPNPEILLAILGEAGFDPSSAMYVGDSLTKDIQMAQDASVYDVLAEYGIAHKDVRYELLREVTHWKPESVKLEKAPPMIHPSASLTHSFAELMTLIRP